MNSKQLLETENKNLIADWLAKGNTIKKYGTDKIVPKDKQGIINIIYYDEVVEVL